MARSPHTVALFWLTLVYAALVVYGTLFPLDAWQTPAGGWSNPITLSLPDQVSRADLIVNLAAYMPLGLFMALWLRARTGWLTALVVTALIGSGLSLTLEILQSALPGRVTSRLDWLANSAGMLAGALLALVADPRVPFGRPLLNWRHAGFVPGALGNLVLIVVAMWALTQAAPFVPSLDWGNLKNGLKPLANTLHHPHSFRPLDALQTALALVALGWLVNMAALRPVMRAFLLFTLAILIFKIAVVGRQLSLESLVGWMAAAAILLVLPLRTQLERLLALAGALLVAYTLAQFAPGAGATTHALNWTPFAGQIGTISGMGDILDTLWPFLALALAVRWITPWRYRRSVLASGAVSVAALAFGLEWMQQSIPGRYPDITDVLLAVLGWVFPWLLTDTQGRVTPQTEPPKTRPLRWALPVVATSLLSLGAVGWSVGSTVKVDIDERGRAVFPAPERLAPIHLPGFNLGHPRLPHPSALEIDRLRSANPQWLNQMRGHAKRGDLHAGIVMAYIEPGSQDLEQLHARLMETRYSYRGAQAKPVALAYDWLYAQWTASQREALREKLAEGVGYLVNFIRRDRLSPYNVYLYNSPFQALMAANLALYGDDPRGELYMRFTYDLWKHRVLPVWRQVMGEQGGWHEGGEYVGIGIGQAIYQVPAMWRAATGEDLFRTEPALRGFLDFAVYRKQPDGTDFRWGDAGFFNRAIPDLTALALEYRHAAAYNLRPPSAAPAPTSWPWGPLTDATLLDPDAHSKLPLARRFDGIGLVVARSDWSPDATYVSFKAGDNYWSHSHLDQGAFTIFKRGGLALDSGVYGPRYGSDHHMNYAYQSVAHNLVTVTDPDDTAESDGKTVRRIANDGGQRRIGSGWGLASAPIDLTDWLDQRTLYHTGRIAAYAEAADHVVAVADVTPAYTNRHSGQGAFSHRTRRVERLWRSFVYDRMADVVVIFDQVDATRPQFQKRWLLHSTGEPQIDGTRFRVDTGRADGGVLFGEVLLPETPRVHPIGGPGFEFWVDGKNYDENGTLLPAIARRGQPVEPGAWRIEVSPPSPREHDRFLVVLAPRTNDHAARPHIQKLQRDHAVGVRLSDSAGVREWWFDTADGSVSLHTASGITRINAGLSYRPPPAWMPDWLATSWQRWHSP